MLVHIRVTGCRPNTARQVMNRSPINIRVHSLHPSMLKYEVFVISKEKESKKNRFETFSGDNESSINSSKKKIIKTI